MAKLRADQSVAAPLLEFMILTATRRNEARLARCSEFEAIACGRYRLIA
jgi:hypothetical protein